MVRILSFYKFDCFTLVGQTFILVTVSTRCCCRCGWVQKTCRCFSSSSCKVQSVENVSAKLVSRSKTKTENVSVPVSPSRKTRLLLKSAALGLFYLLVRSETRAWLSLSLSLSLSRSLSFSCTLSLTFFQCRLPSSAV